MVINRYGSRSYFRVSDSSVEIARTPVRALPNKKRPRSPRARPFYFGQLEHPCYTMSVYLPPYSPLTPSFISPLIPEASARGGVPGAFSLHIAHPAPPDRRTPSSLSLSSANAGHILICDCQSGSEDGVSRGLGHHSALPGKVRIG